MPLTAAYLIALAFLASGPPTLDEALEEADRAYAARGAKSQAVLAEGLLEKAAQTHGEQPEVLWRRARLLVWFGEQTSDAATKAASGLKAWELGSRAAVLAPTRVEGHYYAALGIGQYAIGVGPLRAMAAGVEGKFRTALAAAERLDPDFDDAGIPTTWGRYYSRLPWPKYDPTAARRHLKHALTLSPARQRARWYLAELLVREGDARSAQTLLAEILAGPVGADPSEDTFIQARAQQTLRQLREGER